MNNTNSLKKRNTLAVLKMIKQTPMITQPQIAAKSGLTLPTINKCVREMVESGVVLEYKQTLSNGGRPACAYVFNAEIGFIIGVLIGIQAISVGIFDFDLNIRKKRTVLFDLAQSGVEECIQLIIANINEIIEDFGLPMERYCGIALSVPGPVNHETGMVYNFPNAKKWKDVPLGQVLSDKFKMKVIVEKDNNANVLCWKWLEPLPDDRNAVFLGMKEGIGAGILFNGKVYRGKLCIAGELGHVSVEPSGELCNCKNRGCLELYASEKSIIQRVKAKIAQGEQTMVSEYTTSGEIDIDAVIRAAQECDTVALEAIKDNAKYIQTCIDFIVKIYAPEEVMIDSAWLKAFPKEFYNIVDGFYERTELIHRNDVKITVNKYDDLVFKGAAALMLDHYFTDYENSVFI